MSNAGQAVLGIVGAVVGFFVGGPTGAVYGFQLGYLAGTVLFPTQLPHMQGPRLGDGQQTVSTVGQPIPWVFGTQPVGGNIIWASPIREVANSQTQGGKGAPEQQQTTYTYYRSFAILLCEGPIAGVRRIWANGKVVYDRALPTGLDLDDVTVGSVSEAIQLVIAAQAASHVWSDKMTVYLGTEDQMPDPVIESFKGVGEVPAHRGYAYVVFDDVELKPEDGNRIPTQWKFEVYEDGDETVADIDYFSNEVLYPWIDGGDDPRDPRGEYTYQSASVARDTLAEAIADLTYGAFASGTFIGWSNENSNNDPLSPWDDTVVAGEATKLFGWLTAKDYSGTTDDAGGQCYWAGLTDEVGIWSAGTSGFVHGIYAQRSSLPIVDDVPVTSFGDCGSYYHAIWSDIRIDIARAPQAPPDPCENGTAVSGLTGYCVSVDGLLVPTGGWVYDDANVYRVLQKYATVGDGGVEVSRYPLNPVRPFGHAQYSDQDFWEDAYAEAVARGAMAEGLVYGSDYPVTQNFGYRLANEIQVIDTNPVSLATIVTRVCARVGLTHIDVSDLETVFVIGYQISRPMLARAAIEPLRSVGFFDVVESGSTLKFPVRGKAVAATLVSDDLGAHLAEEERPPSITTRKAQEFELPRQVRVHFQNPDLDYDPGEELSPARFDTAAESVLDVDLAVCIDSDSAAKIAEVLQRDFWAGRWSHTAQVTQGHNALEPADVVAVPVDGNVERMRITALTDRLPNLRSLELVRDDDGTYISHAEGTTAARTPATVPFYGPVDLVLLDLPLLTDSDDDAGIYAATRPLITGGSFRGAVFVRSTDGGDYPSVGSVTGATAMGLILAEISSGPTTIFDEGNEVLVELQYGDLESRTEAEVLDGANTCAAGANGRWEILQFKDAENVAGNIWRLSGLLRGRRGTEHFVSTSQVGDQLVMLSTGTRTRLPLDVAAIGVEQLYKAVPIGTSAEGVDAEEFTGRGVALKPFSPVHVTGVRDDDSNLLLTWVRRDRLASDLLIPMSEDVLDFEIDVLNSSGDALRTISVSEETATYTADQQITDFGSAQASVDVRIYQISATVGRGAAAEASV